MPEQELVGREKELATASTGELVGRLAGEAKELVKKEIDLAKSELKSEVKSELKMAAGMAGAGVAALVTFQLLLAALVLGLAEAMPPWAAALVTAGGFVVLGLVAGAIGWGYHVRNPLSKTRKTLKEDAEWAQQRLS
jgi:uncharacterized membrane protein YqjE